MCKCLYGYLYLISIYNMCSYIYTYMYTYGYLFCSIFISRSMYIEHSMLYCIFLEVLIDTSGQRPADVFLPNFFGGQPVAADVTVSHPSQGLTHARDGGAQVQSASERAALDKVDQKNRKYRRQCEARGVEFVPLAVCAFGGWLPQGEKLIKDIAERSAARTGRDEGVVQAQFWERLSIALWQGNARQILHCPA